LAAADIAMGQATRGVALLHETIASIPAAPEPRLVLAEWLRQEGQGEACLGALGDMSESPAVLRTRAHCEAMRGRSEQALHHVMRLTEISNEPGRVLADMASVVVGDGSDAEATKRFNIVFKRLHAKLDSDQTALARAGFFDALGDGMAALTQLMPVAQRRPDDIDVQLRLSDLQARYGQRRAAVALLEDLVHEDPFDAARLNALGFTLADSGARLSEASVWLHRALRLAPEDAAIWDSLGWLLLRQGQAADAVTWLRRAALRSPGDAEVLRHLGDALVALGSRDEARGAYTKALQTRPPQALRRLIKQRLAVAGGT
jgi:Flp pilus assembly protein TadD